MSNLMDNLKQVCILRVFFQEFIMVECFKKLLMTVEVEEGGPVFCINGVELAPVLVFENHVLGSLFIGGELEEFFSAFVGLIQIKLFHVIVQLLEELPMLLTDLAQDFFFFLYKFLKPWNFILKPICITLFILLLIHRDIPVVHYLLHPIPFRHVDQEHVFQEVLDDWRQVYAFLRKVEVTLSSCTPLYKAWDSTFAVRRADFFQAKHHTDSDAKGPDICLGSVWKFVFHFWRHIEPRACYGLVD